MSLYICVLQLMDGYFVHFFAPEDVPPQPKHIIFVLDTSGSMWGSKLQQLQQAMYSILDSLRSNDYFSIIQFGTNVMVICFSHDIHLVNFCIAVNDVVLLCCGLCMISNNNVCSTDGSEGRNPCFDCKLRWVDILPTMIY